MAELYAVIARLFRRFDMELFQTTEEQDILVKHDAQIGIADRSSIGVQVKVVNERKD